MTRKRRAGSIPAPGIVSRGLPEPERSLVCLITPDFAAVGVRTVQCHVDRVRKVLEAEAVLMRNDAEEMNPLLRRNEDVTGRWFVSVRM